MTPPGPEASQIASATGNSQSSTLTAESGSDGVTPIGRRQAMMGRKQGPFEKLLTHWQVGISLLLALCLYWPVLLKLVHDWWTNPDFSHGFVVPIFSAYVLYRRRAVLATITRSPSWSGLIVVASALLMLVLGSLGAELFLPRISMVFMLAGLTATFWGWRWLRAIAFPVLFLFFAIPIPLLIFNRIALPLQLLASQISAKLLPLVGVPVLREGNIIRLPLMSLEVGEACSGIRSLMSLCTLTAIYGYIAETSNWRRLILIGISLPITVASNAMRIFGTGVCVYYWSADKAMGFFHEFSGVVMFLFSSLLLYGVHRAMRLFGASERAE